MLLLLADEYRQPVPSLRSNPGSLTMGLAEADPRQLAPSVGTTQVGIMISAVPSSASYNSRVRARSNPPEELKIIANLSITSPRSLGPQLDQVQYLGDYTSRHRRKRTRRSRRRAQATTAKPTRTLEQVQELCAEIPLEESQRATEASPATRRPAITRTPAAG